VEDKLLVETNLVRIGHGWRRRVQRESGRVRVFGTRLRHSLPHPLHIREGILRGCGIDIHLVVLGVDSFNPLRGDSGLRLRLVHPGRAFPRPWLHYLLKLFKILVGVVRLIINPIVGLELFSLFASGRGEVGDV
jgi:hypothetical protein